MSLKLNKSQFFTIFIFAIFMMVTPRLCAQSVSAEKATQLRQDFSSYGKKYIGCKYVSGAIGPNTFDCSGFVYTVSRESIGYQLPRQVKNMYSYCKVVDESQRQAGDLVFFKTTGTGEVSHVGIYIGNNQFLHCASDGPNTGVIVSSLKESYWKSKYFKSASFLPQGVEQDSQTNNLNGEDSISSVSPSSQNKIPSDVAERHPILSKFLIDGSFAMDWNFFDAENVRLNLRGFTGTVHARYQNNKFQPGIGTSVRWDTGTGTVQLPIFASFSLGEYFQIFAGPVICLGTPDLPGGDEKIESSFFPGIIGVCWNSPSFDVKKAKVCFAQDIHYTVFNKTDGSALSPIKSIGSGLVFSSGIRVTLPFAQLL